MSPEVLASGLRPLDTGWFARENTFGYQRPDPPILRAGGDAFLEGTPPVLTYYQARSGQKLALALGVERTRAYGLDRLARLKRYLAEAGIAAIGADEDHAAFLAVQLGNAVDVSASLAEHGVVTDARGEWLRLCPDCLTKDEELRLAASSLGEVIEQTPS